MTAPHFLQDSPDALTDRALRRVQEYLARGLHDAAEAAAVAQAKRTPNRFDVWLVASFAHGAAGHARAAEFAVGRALAIRPGHPSAMLQHARLSLANGRTASALASLGALAEEHVLDQDLGLRVIEMLNRLGECERAQALVLNLQGRSDQDSVPLMLAQAETFAQSGDWDNAASIYGELVRTQPRMAYAQLGLAKLQPDRVDGSVLEQYLTQAQVGTDTEVWLAHAAFRAFEAARDHVSASRMLARALQARRRQYQYDATADGPVFEALRQTLPMLAGSARESPAGAGDDVTPLFVMGLPGSGAALIERVLGNHPQVCNGGELPEFSGVVREVAGLDGQSLINKAVIDRFDRIDWDTVGNRYRERLRARYPGARYVTDCGSANPLYAAAILRALPEARVIHVLCEPMQQCFELLREHADEACPYANDQAELVAHYVAMADWMRHVESAFPKRVQSVRYEQWRAVPGLVSRAVFRFCDLSFEPGWEDPERNRKPIGYGSLSRRQPVPSVAESECWRNHRELLQPMHTLLANAGLAPRET